jgi:hypothetical protein
MVDFFQQLFQQSNAQGKRATALQPLLVAAGLILGATIFVASSGPVWLLVVLMVCFGILLLVFLGCFVYFARKKPELLRTEHFALQKMAIQKAAVGDSSRGLVSIDIPQIGQQKAKPQEYEE